MTNKILILLIVIIAAVTIVVVSWRTPTNNILIPTPTPTMTETPTVTDPFAVTPTVTATPTPTVTTTVTPTPTVTVTPTPTVATSTFDEIRSTAWATGANSSQEVGSSVYFINGVNPKVVKKGTSTADAEATVVFTSTNNGEIGSFYVNGGSMYVVTKRDSATGYSKFQKVSLSNGAVVKLYEFVSSKYEATTFAVKKNNDTKTEFYIGLEAVNNASSPAAMQIKNYAQQWIKPFVGVNKDAVFFGLSPNIAGVKLAGEFSTPSMTGDAGDPEVAYIDLE